MGKNVEQAFACAVRGRANGVCGRCYERAPAKLTADDPHRRLPTCPTTRLGTRFATGSASWLATWLTARFSVMTAARPITRTTRAGTTRTRARIAVGTAKNGLRCADHPAFRALRPLKTTFAAFSRLAFRIAQFGALTLAGAAFLASALVLFRTFRDYPAGRLPARNDLQGVCNGVRRFPRRRALPR